MRFLSFLFLFIIFLISCKNKNGVVKENQTNIFYDKAYDFREAGVTDSAFTYYNSAKELFLLRKDSWGLAKCLVNMGIIAKGRHDYFGSQELSLSALQHLNQKDQRQYFYLHSNFNNLSLACYQLKDYKNAIKYNDSALYFAKGSHKDTFLYLGNRAKIFEELKEYTKAIAIYKVVLKGPHKNRQEYARVLVNYAFAKWRQNSNYDPIPEFTAALSIRLRENDSEGLNHSYARLADYYANRNKELAHDFAFKMHQIAKKNDSGNDQLEALYKLVLFSSPSVSKKYFIIYEKLQDSLQTAQSEEKNQFAMIRYETEKHKADNLILQKDNTEKKYQLIKQKALLVGGLTFAFFAVVVSFILYRKRKQKMMLASQNAIRENQLKTSKKVHDVVANGLYRVMAEIENSEQLNREHVLDKLEDMYEKSRDLSYEELHFNDQNFHEKIADLLRSFATETTKVVFVGNTEELWKKVNAQSKYEIEHILQELMVNMKKHSKASNVAIRFEQKDAHIYVYYADNGIGMQTGQEFKNGLTNTGNRIVSINGQITFDTEAEKGLKIQVSFPVS